MRVDLIGPLPKTAVGSKYIMTVSCIFFPNGQRLLHFQIKVQMVQPSSYSRVLLDMDAVKSRLVTKEESLLIRYCRKFCA